MSSNKLSHDEFIKRAKISNPNLLILGTYTRAKDKIKYKCILTSHDDEITIIFNLKSINTWFTNQNIWISPIKR